MKYEVTIVYKGQSTFIVDAGSDDEAEQMALSRYHEGEDGDMPQSDYQDIENINTKEV